MRLTDLPDHLLGAVLEQAPSLALLLVCKRFLAVAEQECPHLWAAADLGCLQLDLLFEGGRAAQRAFLRRAGLLRQLRIELSSPEDRVFQLLRQVRAAAGRAPSALWMHPCRAASRCYAGQGFCGTAEPSPLPQLLVCRHALLCAGCAGLGRQPAEPLHRRPLLVPQARGPCTLARLTSLCSLELSFFDAAAGERLSTTLHALAQLTHIGLHRRAGSATAPPAAPHCTAGNAGLAQAVCADSLQLLEMQAQGHNSRAPPHGGLARRGRRRH